MKRAVKAALLSALLFPGLGQIYLKRYLRGAMLMVLTCSVAGLWMVRAALGALEALQAIEVQGGLVDLHPAADRLATSSLRGDGYSAVILWFLVACWLFSVIDAYVQGNREAAA